MEQAGNFNFPPRVPNLISLDFFYTRSSDKQDLCKDLITVADTPVVLLQNNANIILGTLEKNTTQSIIFQLQ